MDNIFPTFSHRFQVGTTAASGLTFRLTRHRPHDWGLAPRPNDACWAKLGYITLEGSKLCAICAMVKSRYIGDGHLTFNRNPYNWYIKPYYWVDDHPLLYGNSGSLDPSSYVLFDLFCYVLFICVSNGILIRFCMLVLLMAVTSWTLGLSHRILWMLDGAGISAIKSFGVLLFKAAGADDFYLFSTAEDWGLLGHGLHSNDCFVLSCDISEFHN